MASSGGMRQTPSIVGSDSAIFVLPHACGLDAPLDLLREDEFVNHLWGTNDVISQVIG